MICVLDIFILDIFPKFISKKLFLLAVFAYSIFNILIWNWIRYERNLIIDNRNSLAIAKFLFSIVFICFVSLICFFYNFFSIVFIDESDLNKLYYNGKIYFKVLILGNYMYNLLNVIVILYILMNLIIPLSYYKILNKLKKSFLNFDSNREYFKPKAENSINSNNNSNISPRNIGNSLDIMEKK